MREPESLEPLTRSVVQRLRDAIVTGELEPGARLREVDLAAKFHVSRTPLREALREVEADGLVLRYPHVGSFVAPLSPKDADDLYTAKGALQVLLVELACERMDLRDRAQLQSVVDQMQAAITAGDHGYYADLVDRFHELLLQAARSPTLNSLFRMLDLRVRRYRRFVLAQPGREAESFEQHRAIAGTLLRGDVEAARESMRGHARSARSFVSRSMAAYQSGGGEQGHVPATND